MSVSINDDVESLDVDVDRILWSDEPEQAYLEQFAGKGVHTSDNSLVNSSSNNNNNKSLLNQADVHSESSFTAKYFPESSSPPDEKKTADLTEDMDDNDAEAAATFPTSYVFNHEDHDDDVSTLANDTVHRFPTNSTRDQEMPSDYDDYYRAQEYYKQKHGLNQLPQGGGEKPASEKAKKKRRSAFDTGSGWTKRNYTCATVMALFLLAVIAGLSYTFYRLDQDSKTVSQEEGFSDWTFRPTATSQRVTLAPIQTPRPTPAPIVPGTPTSTPTTPNPSKRPTLNPTSLPTLLPTVSPTGMPSTGPTLSQRDDFVSILAAETSTLTMQAIGETGTPQQQAFDWLVEDPNYFNYLRRQRIQRFALATLYHSVNGDQYEALETWMDYNADECTWFTSWYENRLACGSDGIFKFLALRNLGLQGRLPTELTLLSKLNALVMHDNALSGSIPSEFGEWTSLTTLDLRGNSLEGRVPGWSNVPNLLSLDISQNDGLTGDLSELCPFSMDTLAADCDQVYCTCCTNCQSTDAPDPTPPPTTVAPQPTAQPTPPPTLAPAVVPTPTNAPVNGGCVNSVRTNKSCYAEGETIQVSFTNCDPIGNDWLGLYDAADPMDGLFRPLLWHWSCGTQTCWGAVPEGGVSFDRLSDGGNNWPLPRGNTYKVWLFRRGASGGPYPAFAESQEIRITRNGC